MRSDDTMPSQNENQNGTSPSTDRENFFFLHHLLFHTCLKQLTPIQLQQQTQTIHNSLSSQLQINPTRSQSI